MADNEVSKLTWIAIVVALAASIYFVAKPQINTLANSTFGKISAVVEGIGKDINHTAYANIVFLCKESGNFKLSEASLVRYGSDSRWVYKELQAGDYFASNTFFGSDPARGTVKNVELVSKFSTSNSIDKTHIGTYTDKSKSASQEPSKYTWQLNPDYHE